MAVILINRPVGKGEIIRLDQSDYDFLVAKKDSSETWSMDVNGLPASTSNQNIWYETVNLGDLAADSDAIAPVIFKKPEAVAIVAIWIAVDTTVGADAVNYNTIDIKQDDGDASLMSSPYDTQAGLTLATPVDMGVDQNLSQIADESLYLDLTLTASGKALSGAVLFISYTLAA